MQDHLLALNETTPDEAPPPYTPYARPDEQVVESGSQGWNNPPPRPARPTPPLNISGATSASARPTLPSRPVPGGSNSGRPASAQPSYSNQFLNPNQGSASLLNLHRPGPTVVGGGTNSQGARVSYAPLYPQSNQQSGPTMPWCWKCEDTGYKRPGKPCNRCPRGEAVRLGIRTCPQCFTAPRLTPRGPCPACGTRLPSSVWDFQTHRGPFSSLMSELAQLTLQPYDPYPVAGSGGGRVNYAVPVPGSVVGLGGVRPPFLPFGAGVPSPFLATAGNSRPATTTSQYQYRHNSYPHNGHSHSDVNLNRGQRSASLRQPAAPYGGGPAHGRHYGTYSGRTRSASQTSLNSTQTTPTSSSSSTTSPSCFVCRSRHRLHEEQLIPDSVMRNLPNRCPMCNSTWGSPLRTGTAA
ncbi:hypothetical protein H4R33_004261 [Dimargaris cristalligena]|nr:hypothetical protein H4R33_004261 [Dimargaris cristalligena]